MPFALSMVMELQRNNGLPNNSGENKSAPGSGKPARRSAVSKSASTDNKSRPSSKTNKADRHLLGELCVDKEYLEQLLKHPGEVTFCYWLPDVSDAAVEAILARVTGLSFCWPVTVSTL